MKTSKFKLHPFKINFNQIQICQYSSKHAFIFHVLEFILNSKLILNNFYMFGRMLEYNLKLILN